MLEQYLTGLRNLLVTLSNEVTTVDIFYWASPLHDDNFQEALDMLDPHLPCAVEGTEDALKYFKQGISAINEASLKLQVAKNFHAAGLTAIADLTVEVSYSTCSVFVGDKQLCTVSADNMSLETPLPWKTT